MTRTCVQLGVQNAIVSKYKSTAPTRSSQPLQRKAAETAVSIDTNKSEATAPSISVVIVSDYAAGQHGGWLDIRKSLAALALQDLQEPAEFIFCESEEFRAQMPVDLTEIVPHLKIIFAPGPSSYELKNVAVQAASSRFIAMLDADCTPRSDWLRRVLEFLRTHPEAAAVSGMTIYGGKSLSVRLSSLLSRAYSNPGNDGPTRRTIADNNAGYQRSAYLAHPLPPHMGGFAAHVQSRKLLREGHQLWFDSAIRAEHDFEGWSMEKDVRRHRGYSAVRTRLIDKSLPYSWLTRLGPIGIAPLLAGKILTSWWDCVRCGPAYGIRWFELPVAMIASVGVGLLEVPGMLAAFRKRGIG